MTFSMGVIVGLSLAVLVVMLWAERAHVGPALAAGARWLGATVRSWFQKKQ